MRNKGTLDGKCEGERLHGVILQGEADYETTTTINSNTVVT
jgi:hypothetical protein